MGAYIASSNCICIGRVKAFWKHEAVCIRRTHVTAYRHRDIKDQAVIGDGVHWLPGALHRVEKKRTIQNHWQLHTIIPCTRRTSLRFVFASNTLAHAPSTTTSPDNSLPTSTTNTDAHRPISAAPLTSTLSKRQQREQPTNHRPRSKRDSWVTTPNKSALARQTEKEDNTHSPLVASYKSVNGKFVLVAPSHAAIVETNFSLSAGDETAATKSSQSSVCLG